MNTEISIVAAKFSDVDEIYRLLSDSVEEWVKGFPPADPLALMKWVIQVVANEFCNIALVSGEIVGSCGLEPTTVPWNPSAPYLGGGWFYVKPEYRVGGTGTTLLADMIGAAKKRNIPVAMSVTWGKDAKVKDTFLRDNNLQYVGGNFVCGFDTRGNGSKTAEQILAERKAEKEESVAAPGVE